MCGCVLWTDGRAAYCHFPVLGLVVTPFRVAVDCCLWPTTPGIDRVRVTNLGCDRDCDLGYGLGCSLVTLDCGPGWFGYGLGSFGCGGVGSGDGGADGLWEGFQRVTDRWD